MQRERIAVGSRMGSKLPRTARISGLRAPNEHAGGADTVRANRQRAPAKRVVWWVLRCAATRMAVVDVLERRADCGTQSGEQVGNRVWSKCGANGADR